MSAYLLFFDPEEIIETETVAEALKMKDEGWQSTPKVAVNVEQLAEAINMLEKLYSDLGSGEMSASKFWKERRAEIKNIVERHWS